MDKQETIEQDSYLATSNLYLETCFANELLPQYSDGLKLVQSFNHKPIFVWVVSYPPDDSKTLSGKGLNGLSNDLDLYNKLSFEEAVAELEASAHLEAPNLEKKWAFNLLEKSQFGFPLSFRTR